MLERCRNPHNQAFHRYGARGITVCERWLVFENFIADMGERPSPKHTLERMDNSKGYEPSNCCWETRTRQARNRRSNRLVTFRGETKSVAEWAEVTGIHPSCITGRLNLGWTADEALTTPPRKNK